MAIKFSKSSSVKSTLPVNDFPEFREAEKEVPGVIRSEIAATMGSFSSTTQGAYFGRRIPSSTSLMDRLQFGLMPKNLIEAIEFSYNWYEKDDALSSLIDLKTEFTVLGFRLVAHVDDKAYFEMLQKSKDDKDEEIDDDILNLIYQQIELNDKLQRISSAFQLDSVTDSLARDFFITDSMALYWKLPGKGNQGEVDANIDLALFDSEVPGLIDVSALSLKDVQWDNSLGKNELSVKIPIELRERIQLALDYDDKKVAKTMVEGLLSEGVPVKYIEAVKAKDDYVLLEKEDGDNWRIFTKERKHHGLASPSMVKIFIPLATRMMMTEGDFAASVMTKHFIFHITSGESIDSGPNAGSTKNWASPDETNRLQGLFSGINKTTVVATNHTVKMAFIFPPIEMFSHEKYMASLQRILNWAGISLVLYTGEGSKYAGGHINLKRVMSGIKYARNKIRDLFEKMFSSEEIRSAINVPDGFSIHVEFDSLGLREERQILDELKLMCERGTVGPNTVNEELGRSHQNSRFDRIVAIMEDRRFGLWGSGFLSNEINSVNTGSAGRPPNSETSVNDETRLQNPETPET